MKFSGPEVAARRVAERRFKALYNYGDMVAFKALKFPAPDWRAAYYAACALPSDTGYRIVVFGGIGEVCNTDDATYLGGDCSEDDQPTLDLTILDPRFARKSAEIWQTVLETENEPPKLTFVSEFRHPLALIGHSMIPYTRKNKVILYGGVVLNNRSLFSDVYVMSLKSLEIKKLKVKSPQPPGRLRHGACIVNDMMYVYGGQSHQSNAIVLEDLWVLDLVSSQWQKIVPRVYTKLVNDTVEITSQEAYELSQGPGKRYGHHLVHYQGKIYLAFGSDGYKVFNDVWAYDLERSFWYKVDLFSHTKDVYTGLRGRTDFASCLNVTTGSWLFHGGVNEEGELHNTLLEINLNSFECRRMRAEVIDLSALSSDIRETSSMSSTCSSNRSTLPRLRGHAMCSIPNTKYTAVFGGVDRHNDFSRNCYLLLSTGQCPMKLRKVPSSISLEELNCLVQPIFDSTYSSTRNPRKPLKQSFDFIKTDAVVSEDSGLSSRIFSRTGITETPSQKDTDFAEEAPLSVPCITQYEQQASKQHPYEQQASKQHPYEQQASKQHPYEQQASALTERPLTVQSLTVPEEKHPTVELLRYQHTELVKENQALKQQLEEAKVELKQQQEIMIQAVHMLTQAALRKGA